MRREEGREGREELLVFNSGQVSTLRRLRHGLGGQEASSKTHREEYSPSKNRKCIGSESEVGLICNHTHTRLHGWSYK